MFELSREQEKRAVELHKKATVVDGLVPIQDALPERLSKGERKVFNKRYLKKMVAGGLNVANVPVISAHEKNALRVIQNISDYHSDLEECADRFAIIMNSTQLEDAKKQGKIAIILGLQNAEPVDGDLRTLRIFHRLGIRIIIPVYGRKTMIGDGCSERTNCGLSDFGVQLIREMNRLGILIDLSHTGRATFMDAVEVSEKPIVATHACVNALVETTRNLKDEQIQAIAQKGGVVGINGFPGFVARPKATINDFINHIDYVVKLVGVDHVGIGLDFLDWEKESIVPFAKNLIKAHPDVFGTTVDFPEGLEDGTKYVNITRGLVDRGYSDDDIIKILGGNFLRVFRKIF